MKIVIRSATDSAIDKVRGKFNRDQYEDMVAYSDLISAKTKMLAKLPFWGVLGINLRLVEEPTGALTTLATDGRNIYYSAEFIKRLSAGERMFAIAHEVSHCLYDHVGKNSRQGGRNSELWQQATDYMINGELVQAKVGDKITTIKIYHDEKYDGWSTDSIYTDLEENGAADDMEPMDYHIELVAGGDEGEDGEGVTVSSGDGDSELEKAWTQAVTQAVAAQREAAAKGLGDAGELPASVQRLIDGLSKPTINWKQVLRQHVKTFLSRGYSFNRPNRKTFNNGIILPGFRKDSQKLEVVVAIDTSGSVDAVMLKEFVSELKGIMQSFPAFDITAFCFDAGMETIKESVTHITRTQGDFADVGKFAQNITGGGGTLFETIFEYLEEERIKPRILLVLTDGEPFGSWGDPNYCKTLWLVNNQYRERTAPFGITMQYEPKG